MNIVPHVYAVSLEEAENPSTLALKMEIRILGLRLEKLGVLVLFFFFVSVESFWYFSIFIPGQSSPQVFKLLQF